MKLDIIGSVASGKTTLARYLSEKSESFLTEHDFSKEEVLDGMNRLVQKAGYGDLLNIVEGLQVI